MAQGEFKKRVTKNDFHTSRRLGTMIHTSKGRSSWEADQLRKHREAMIAKGEAEKDNPREELGAWKQRMTRLRRLA